MKVSETVMKTRIEDCPHCEDGKFWTSKYGGNDPDVWAIPCEHCEATGKVEVEIEDEEEDD